MTKKSDAPEIRFKGFSDAWEQRKFLDITFPAGEKNMLSENKKRMVVAICAEEEISLTYNSELSRVCKCFYIL